MVVYKLYYYNFMGRAECIRLMFAQAGVPFEDIRLSPEEWEKMKEGTPCGQIPVLEVDGVKYAQSNAIIRYLANKFNMIGKDEFEILRADMIGEFLTDIALKFPWGEKDEDKKKELGHIALTETIPVLLKKLEKLLVQQDNGDKYFVSKLTPADLAWMSISLFFVAMRPDILAETPKLAGLAKRVAALPKIAKWLEIRPKTIM